MKHSFKISALWALCLALVFTACNEDLLDEQADATGEGAAITGTIGGASGFTIIPGQTISGNILVRGIVVVQPGQTLRILAGTNLIGELAGQNPAGRSATIVVPRSARIIAQGNPNQPIVFTSRRGSNKQPGDIGGIILLGRAYANVAAGVGDAPFNYVGQIEGIPDDLSPELFRYGSGDSNPGVNINDDSGILSYVRIEYAGNVLTEGNETNGLTLGGVGNGTQLDHIQVTRGADDAFEWFGGSVNAKYLYAFANVDDDFDTDQGFFGSIQYAVGVKNPNITNTFGNDETESRGFESNGDDSDDVNPALYTDATFANVTLIGPNTPFDYCGGGVGADGATADGGLSGNFDYGVIVRDESRLDLFNSRIMAYPVSQYHIENPTPPSAIPPGPYASITQPNADIAGNFAGRPNFAAAQTASTGNEEGPTVNRSYWTSRGNRDGRGLGCFAFCDPNGATKNVLVESGLRCAAGFLPVRGSQKPIYVPYDNFSSDVVALSDSFFDAVNFTGAFSANAADNAGWNFDSNWVEFTPEDNVYF